jgi:hypothetical protein
MSITFTQSLIMAEHQPETVEKNLELDDDGKPRRTGTYILLFFLNSHFISVSDSLILLFH